MGQGGGGGGVGGGSQGETARPSRHEGVGVNTHTQGPIGRRCFGPVKVVRVG